MSVINTNITSMIGQQNLNESKNALTTSMERLSSGLRINSAKDDAAGQAIANRMSSQITGLSQAQRNANDGISVAQTAEGALNQVNDNLQRVRELSVQAENGTNSQDDLQSIQDEIGQRLSEIDRVSEQTNFNGVNVLDTNEGLKIQVGANDNESITVNLQQINRETLGLQGFTVAGDQVTTEKQLEDDFNASLTSAEFGQNGSADYSVDDTGKITVGNAATTGTAVYADSAGDLTTTESRNALGTDTSDKAASAVSSSFDAILGSESNWTQESGSGYATDSNNNSAASWEYSLEVDGEKFTANISQAAGATASTGQVSTTITREDGSTFAGTIYAANDGTFTTTEDREAATVNDVTSNGYGQTSAEYNVASGANSGDYTVDANGGVVVKGDAEALYTSRDDKGNVSLVTEDKASKATANPMETLDDALKSVDSLRSELGAVQNRFESAITNLSTNETNLSSARSRIEDADYATEVANMTKNQILQQAGTSVLAQANQLPQSVLSLLG